MKKWILTFLFGFCVLCWANLTQAEEDQFQPQIGVSGPVLEEPTFPMAKQLMEKRKWSEAVALLRALLKKDPKSIQVNTSLAMALTYLGNREEALEILKFGVRAHKGDERVFLIQRIRVLSCLFLTNKTFQTYQDGLNLLMTKKFRAARERFEKALIEEPDNVEILTRLGQSLLMDDEPGKAVSSLKLARKLNEFQPEVRLWLGRALFQLNLGGEAVTELTAAGTELRGSELAPIWLADALSLAGQSNSAIRLLDNDIKHWPMHILSLINLARFRIQGNLGQHIESQILWAARKDLQLAASRLDQYSSSDFNRYSGDLTVDVARPTSEIKIEIQRLQQQVESRLSQATNSSYFVK